MDLNRVMIIGNATRDPEMRTTTSGQNVCSFGVTTNRAWTDAAGQKQEQAEFHNIVAWAKLAEICSQYLTKGRKVYVEGRLQTREWQAQDGTKRNRTEIVADNMILLDRGPARNTGASPSPFASQQSVEVVSEAPVSSPSDDAPADDSGIKVEAIPF